MFVVKIKFNCNTVFNQKLKHTKKPQTYQEYKKHQGYQRLPIYFKVC